jgi:hypothetical protein
MREDRMTMGYFGTKKGHHRIGPKMNQKHPVGRHQKVSCYASGVMSLLSGVDVVEKDASMIVAVYCTFVSFVMMLYILRKIQVTKILMRIEITSTKIIHALR